MIKLLYLTDTHFRSLSPRCRTDDFFSSVQQKVQEIVEYANDNDVDAILHGGDFFDSPEPGLKQIGNFLSILSYLKAPIYVVPGNHDISGHNPKTVDRSMLGLLYHIGFLKKLSHDSVVIEKDGVSVQITGQGFHQNIDAVDSVFNDYIVTEKQADYAVHCVHGFAVPLNTATILQKYISDITVIENVLAQTQADYTLTGHFHYPFTVEKEGKWGINPGALVRISAAVQEIQRAPSFVLIKCDEAGINHEIIPLQCAKTGEEVISRSHIEIAQIQKEHRESFMMRLRSFAHDFYSFLEPEEVLGEIITQIHADPDVQSVVWERFQSAKSEQGNS